MTNQTTTADPGADAPPPGVCVPFTKKLDELGGVKGDESLVRGAWEELDAAAYMYLWFWVHR